MNRPTRAAVLFVNYGPYHVARARSLLRIPGLDPVFLELAREEEKYKWVSDRSALGDSLITVMERPYEQCLPAEMRNAVNAKLDQIRPEAIAVAGYSEPGMRAAAKWARRNGARVVLMGDSVEWGYRRHWWRELPKRWWIRRHADAGFVAGTASRDYLVKLGVSPDQIWTPYDVVDNQFFKTETERIRMAERTFREELRLPEKFFLFVGRLVEEKNLPILLPAYARYRKTVASPWSLVLVGDGPLRELAHSLAAQYGSEGIHWIGSVSHTELPPYFALAKALILPSRRETWGLVVNEAMASGLPVLVSNKCGCSLDLVRDGRNGFTFTPTVEGTSKALKKLSQLPEQDLKAMGEASTALIAEYSPETWAQNLALAMFPNGRTRPRAAYSS